MWQTTEKKNGEDIVVLHLDGADVEATIKAFIEKVFPDYAQGYTMHVVSVADGSGEFRVELIKSGAA